MTLAGAAAQQYKRVNLGTPNASSACGMVGWTRYRIGKVCNLVDDVESLRADRGLRRR
jgi:hypothetical protein